MKKPLHFSLLALMVVITFLSIFMGLSKLFSIEVVAIWIIIVIAIVMLGFAIRIFFFNR